MQVSYDQFLLFGDSITQYSFDGHERGFGAQLAHLFQRRLDLVNRGFSGYTTSQAIHLLPQFLPRKDNIAENTPKVQFLSIFYGVNDSCLPGSVQHVDLDQYELQLRRLVGMVHDPTSPTYSPETKIILICPTPVDEEAWRARRLSQGRPMDRSADATRLYAEKCLHVAQDLQAKAEGISQRETALHRVSVIPTWEIIMARVQSGQHSLADYFKDGVHLSAKGNDLIFHEIMKVIRSEYPEWDPETMTMNAPWWGDLDLEHPEKDLLIGANKKP